MCGIVGYVGERPAIPVLLGGLRRLEYRGYDSAGVAVPVDGHVFVCKRSGRVDDLERALASQPDPGGTAGIGHTRWATHGRPSDQNAHPHSNEDGRFAVVHNGIIENYLDLRQELSDRGHSFSSETDSEVVAHLLEECWSGDLPSAVRAAVSRLEGSFALGVLSPLAPGVLVAVRHQAPLVIGLGDGENFLASDMAALLQHTRTALVLEDGEMAVLTAGSAAVTDAGGRAVVRPPLHIAWEPGAAERGGFAHFMRKEIHEQPQALRETLRGRLQRDGAILAELGAEARGPGATSSPGEAGADGGGAREAGGAGEGGRPLAPRLRSATRVTFVACGTAYHASLVGAKLCERWARVPATAEMASEFRYRGPLIGESDLVVAVSQSGETADTLAALREARRLGALDLAISNVVGSTLSREATATLHTQAGPEIAVASTKAYTTQIALLGLFALHLAALRSALPVADRRAAVAALQALPQWAEEALALEDRVRAVAESIATREHVFFIGRGLDWAAAMEGQLKLKEISYIHAEAYPAGELKHGTLALVEEGTPVVALFTQPELAAKTASNVAEVRARGGRSVGIATASLEEAARGVCDEVLVLPDVPGWLAPVVAAVPLQLLAYHAAMARGCDVDKPRNLAKSVTVE